MTAERQEGGCRCGAVRFRVTGQPAITFACHCKGCQRMTASAFSLSSLYPAERFQQLSGTTVLGGLKGATKHSFCESCMSWLWTVPEGLDGFVNIRSTLLDKPEGHAPFADTWLSEGLPWVSSGAPKKFDKLPEESEFGPLMAEYADWGLRA